MGTGKTITSIAIAGALYLDRKIRRVLVVAPLSIVGVWEEEFDKFADFPYTLQVLTGTGAKKAAALKKLYGSELQVAVINYESAWRLEAEITGWHGVLVFRFKDGSEKTLYWEKRSRCDSWTDEMKAVAKQHAAARREHDHE